MAKAKMNKFKVGDKVRILPKATWIGIWGEEVGKVGKITSVGNDSFCVRMLDPRKGKQRLWLVDSSMITPAPIKGQQLLFSFMSAMDGT